LGLTFFTLPSNYSVTLHQKIFQIVYYANGGFNWSDVYFMPIKLREFYWRELLKAKEEENAAVQNANKSINTSKTKRR
jgi:hypothetical protein